VIVLAPGSSVWNLAGHASWLTGGVIAVTEGCVILTFVLLALMWFQPPGLRCLLAVALGLVLLVQAVRGIAAVSFVARPFVAYHFAPLYPHAPNTSFPSLTTAFFALVAVPVICSWRKLGWVIVAITLEVAFGCVYVGVHYITDVAAGALLGSVCGGVTWLLFGYSPIARLVAAADDVLRKAHLRRRSATASAE
jgi:undecaprenyl-diphosphatase